MFSMLELMHAFSFPSTLFKILFIDEQGIPLPMGTWGEISVFNQMYYLKNIGSNAEKKKFGGNVEKFK